MDCISLIHFFFPQCLLQCLAHWEYSINNDWLAEPHGYSSPICTTSNITTLSIRYVCVPEIMLRILHVSAHSFIFTKFISAKYCNCSHFIDPFIQLHGVTQPFRERGRLQYRHLIPNVFLTLCNTTFSPNPTNKKICLLMIYYVPGTTISTLNNF